jgi:Cof subfamily protein (haloacid dehalogenase superfamily)
MPSPLYVSDLDGTLLRGDATLSEFSRGTLNGLIGRGVAFTIATARSVVSAASILDGLGLKLPIIEFNGAFISDLKTGRHEVVNAMPALIVVDLYGLIVEAGGAPLISSFNGDHDCVYYREAVNAGMDWYVQDRLKNRDPRWRQTDDLRCSFADQVVCLTVIDQAIRLADLERVVLASHGQTVVTHLFENLYSPPWHWLTIHDRRATKDQAIRTLADRYGLADREVVVFGDQLNDLPMFRAARRAYAVANAHEELKPHALELIGANHEDSVARFIEADWSKAVS